MHFFRSRSKVASYKTWKDSLLVFAKESKLRRTSCDRRLLEDRWLKLRFKN